MPQDAGAAGLDESIGFRKAYLFVSTYDAGPQIDEVVDLDWLLDPSDTLGAPVDPALEDAGCLHPLEGISEHSRCGHLADTGAPLVVVCGIASEYLLMEEQVGLLVGNLDGLSVLMAPVKRGDSLEVLVGTPDHPFSLVGHRGVDTEQVISFDPRLIDHGVVGPHVVPDLIEDEGFRHADPVALIAGQHTFAEVVTLGEEEDDVGRMADLTDVLDVLVQRLEGLRQVSRSCLLPTEVEDLFMR